MDLFKLYFEGFAPHFFQYIELALHFIRVFIHIRRAQFILAAKGDIEKRPQTQRKDLGCRFYRAFSLNVSVHNLDLGSMKQRKFVSFIRYHLPHPLFWAKKVEQQWNKKTTSLIHFFPRCCWTRLRWDEMNWEKGGQREKKRLNKLARKQYNRSKPYSKYLLAPAATFNPEIWREICIYVCYCVSSAEDHSSFGHVPLQI